MVEITHAPEYRRVLVLGGSGMLGSTIVRELLSAPKIDVHASVRDQDALPPDIRRGLGARLFELDVLDHDARFQLLAEIRPDVVVNAVGVVKQAPALADNVRTVRSNALLPHLLAQECEHLGGRLVHVSTDCVFSGRHGGYRETDTPDPVDFYGRSKLLGELEAPALTLRTSIIGHEVQRHTSLVDWFLTQQETSVRGFVHAIYSGVTTHEFARLLRDIVIPRPSLQGLYHVAAEPISKLELLRLVAEVYGWRGEIVPFEEFRCDRSMRADRLFAATGYRPPPWSKMIQGMYDARPKWAVMPGEEGTTT